MSGLTDHNLSLSRLILPKGNDINGNRSMSSLFELSCWPALKHLSHGITQDQTQAEINML